MTDTALLVPLAGGFAYQRSIAGVTPDVTIEESARDELVITEHPVEQGAPISDHAYKRPCEVTIRAGFGEGYGWDDVTAPGGAYGFLLSAQAAFTPFDLYTGKRKYTNMLIQGLSQTTDSHSEHTLMITVALREVILVATQLKESPTGVGSNQSAPESTGGSVDRGQLDPIDPSPQLNADSQQSLGAVVPASTG